RGAPRAPVLPADRPRARGRARPAARRVAALARRAAAGGGIAVWCFDRKNWSHWLLLVLVAGLLLSYFGFVWRRPARDGSAGCPRASAHGADAVTRSPRLRVGVVVGGRSGAHEVSLASAASVITALEARGHTVVPIGIARDGRWVVGGDPLRALAAEARVALP